MPYMRYPSFLIASLLSLSLGAGGCAASADTEEDVTQDDLKAPGGRRYAGDLVAGSGSVVLRGATADALAPAIRIVAQAQDTVSLDVAELPRGIRLRVTDSKGVDIAALPVPWAGPEEALIRDPEIYDPRNQSLSGMTKASVGIVFPKKGSYFVFLLSKDPVSVSLTRLYRKGETAPGAWKQGMTSTMQGTVRTDQQQPTYRQCQVKGTAVMCGDLAFPFSQPTAAIDADTGAFSYSATSAAGDVIASLKGRVVPGGRLVITDYMRGDGGYVHAQNKVLKLVPTP